ncbi:MAG: hypothetical protein ACLQIB_28300 [Isosphaeraceae bacterium]
MPPRPAEPVVDGEIVAAIQRGVDFLIEVQNDDGSWGSPHRTKDLNILAGIGSHHAYRTAVTALCVSALIEVSSSSRSKLCDPVAVRRAIERGEEYLFRELPLVRRDEPMLIYNVWSHAYGISALVRMHGRLPHDAARRVRIEQAIREQYERLTRYESAEGGWGYLDFGAGTQRPNSYACSFVNATVLVAFHEAKEIGILPPEKLVRRGVEGIIQQRNPDFSYLYGLYLRYRPSMLINRPGGSLGRSQACNVALRMWGDTAVTDAVLTEWLDRLIVRNGWLDMGRKRPIPHESHFMVAGYFYYYGHYYATLCVDQLPPKARPFYKDHLARIVLSHQERDGSWWDYPLYNYHQQYGTAFALLSLEHSRKAVASRSGEPVPAPVPSSFGRLPIRDGQNVVPGEPQTKQERTATDKSQKAGKTVERPLDAARTLDFQGRQALSRKLGLWSRIALGEHFDRALLLGVEAVRYGATSEARDGLLRAMNANPGLDSFLRANEGRIGSVAFAPDGRALAAGYSAGDYRVGGVVLWDIGRRERLGTPLPVDEGGVWSVAFAPDGRTLAAGYGNRGRGGVVLWDLGRRKRLGTPLAVDEGGVDTVAFAPDGRTIAAGFAAPIPRGGVVLWDVGRRERLGAPLEQFGWLAGLAFSPDGRTIAAGYYLNDQRGSGVTLWDVARREVLGKLLPVDGDHVGSIAFAPDGRTLAAGYSANNDRGGVLLWDVGRRERLGAPLLVDEGGVRSIAFAPDGRTLAAGFYTKGGGGMVLWEVGRRERLGAPLEVDVGGVWCVAFAPDGQALAGGYFERDRGGMVLWDVARPERLGIPLRLDEGTGGSVAFSPDGRTLAVGYTAKNPEHRTTNHRGGVVLWDMERRQRLGPPLKVDGDWSDGLAFAPDGGSIAAGYTATDHLSGVVLWDAKSRERLGAPLTFDGGSISNVAFAPDGRTIAAGYAIPYLHGGVVLWDVGRRERLGTPLSVNEGLVQSVAFAPDGRTLAAGYARGGVVGGVVLCDAGRRERLGAPLAVDRSEVSSVAFAPDGRTIAAACSRTGVVLWDVGRRERLGAPLEIDDGRGMVSCVAFAPDGRTIAAACHFDDEPGGVVLWDVARRERLGTPLNFHHGKDIVYQISSVAFAPDGRTIATANSSDPGYVVLWDVDPDSWVRRAVRIANRNLSWAEWQRCVGPDVPYHRTIANLPDGEGVAEARQAQAARR